MALLAGVALLSGCAAASPGSTSAATGELASISPTAGALVSGAQVTLTGKNLAGVTRVTFDGVGGTDVAVVSDTEVTVRVPVAANYLPATEQVHVFAGNEIVDESSEITYGRAIVTPVDAQLAYAFEHWSAATYNLAVYGEFNSVGGDCMNFVSQTLLARGFAMTADWSFTSKSTYTGAWIYTPTFDNYLTAHPELGFTRLGVDQRDQVSVGDLVVFDWEGNNSPDHIQVVSDIRTVDGRQQILMVGHNTDSDWRDFDSVITVDHPGAEAWFWKVP